jgi:molybdopterin-guanine dinucleotide biosynthesis protein A
MTNRIGGVVLAGGRSSRFGRDKLVEPIDGRPLLHHAIAAVQAVADKVVVVAAPGHDPVLPEGVRLVHDATAFQGPLEGLAVGLEALGRSVRSAVVVAGDMPSLQPAVLSRLLATLDADVDVSVAMLEVNGEEVPLPIAVDRDTALVTARALLDGGERRLRDLLGVMPGSVIAEASWRLDDPDGATLRDIDTASDLQSGTNRRR